MSKSVGGPSKVSNNSRSKKSQSSRVIVSRVEEDPPTSAGAIIRKIRQWKGLTQVQLARLYGVNQAVIAKVEARDDIRLSTLRKFASTLDLKLTLSLSSGTGGREPKNILEIPLLPLTRGSNGKEK